MSSKRQQKKTTGGTNAKPIVGGDLDPACYMIWARMSAREYWWPAYRCEESVHAPKKPAINTGAKEKGASGGAEDETETELVAFYTGRKKAGSTKTQHLMAWVDADDTRPYGSFRDRVDLQRGKDFQAAVREADADYADYLRNAGGSQEDSHATSAAAVSSSSAATASTQPAALIEQATQSKTGIGLENIGFTLGPLPDGLQQTLKPGRKGFVVQMLEGKRRRTPHTVLSVDHTDALMPSYSRVVTDEAVLEDARGEEGTEVEADFMGEGKYYKGTISSANRDGTFDIVYNDGDVEFNKDPAEIRRIKVHTAAAAAAAAGGGQAEGGGEILSPVKRQLTDL